jgi:DNA-binding NtrC family response regulator
MSIRVLIIEDDEQLSGTFRRILERSGYGVDVVRDASSAAAKMAAVSYDVIFTDINLVGEKTGIDVLKESKRLSPDTPVIIITGFPDVSTASEAVRSGAFDYLCKPVEKELLQRIARAAVKHRELSVEKERLRSDLEAVFRSVSEAIITLDRELVITNMNDAADGLCVFRRESVGTKLDPDGVSCGLSCLRAVEETMQTCRPAGITRTECSFSPTARKLAMNISPLLDQHQACHGAVIVIRDETRLDALERDLQKRTQFHESIVGKSAAMQEIYSLIEQCAGVQTTVLITGESGTGKELVAGALHYAGPRRDKPFVKVNCSALSENLLESELFGHVKGAFTGALKDRTGRFEMASGGTIFLDEIGDISPVIQQKLLRVLQEKEFERVGDSSPVQVDVRIVAATNKDLKALVAKGKFREDLFYRLKVVEIRIPPLRERREDIPLLVGFFLSGFSAEFGKQLTSLSAEAMQAVMEYPWPGNVRELRHALESAAVLCKGSEVALADLPAEVREYRPAALPADLTTDEASIILRTLKETKWNKAEVARILGISRQTLYRKLKELDIEE